MTGFFLARGVITHLHDGDTVTADLDIGWYIHLTERRIRVAHINAPELRTVEGKSALAYAESIMPLGTLVTVKSLTRPDKYGRVLAELGLPDGSDFAEKMLAAGHAAAYEGLNFPS